MVEARLDRGMVNESWHSLWPHTSVSIGTCLGSDHCPVVVKVVSKKERRKNLFRFEAFWTKEGEFKAIVEDAWNIDRDGNSLSSEMELEDE